MSFFSTLVLSKVALNSMCDRRYECMYSKLEWPHPEECDPFICLELVLVCTLHEYVCVLRQPHWRLFTGSPPAKARATIFVQYNWMSHLPHCRFQPSTKTPHPLAVVERRHVVDALFCSLAFWRVTVRTCARSLVVSNRPNALKSIPNNIPANSMHQPLRRHSKIAHTIEHRRTKQVPARTNPAIQAIENDAKLSIVLVQVCHAVDRWHLYRSNEAMRIQYPFRGHSNLGKWKRNNLLVILDWRKYLSHKYSPSSLISANTSSRHSSERAFRTNLWAGMVLSLKRIVRSE